MNAYSNILFLDLESTVIDHWSNYVPLESNIAKMRKIIADHDIGVVGIYSYAVWSHDNVKYLLEHPFFERLHKETGGRLLESLIVPTWSMCEEFAKNAPGGNPPDLNMIWRNLSKEVTFPQYVDATHGLYKGTSYHLFDDTVRDMRITIDRPDTRYDIFFHHA